VFPASKAYTTAYNDCLVSGLLLAVLKAAATRVLNHITTALSALLRESHHPLCRPLAPKISLGLKASTGCIYWTTGSNSVKGTRISPADLLALVNTAKDPQKLLGFATVNSSAVCGSRTRPVRKSHGL